MFWCCRCGEAVVREGQNLALCRNIEMINKGADVITLWFLFVLVLRYPRARLLCERTADDLAQESLQCRGYWL